MPLPYLALMAPKSDQLCIQSFFGIQGQGRQVVELVKAKNSSLLYIVRVRHLNLDRISPNLSKAYLNHLNLYDIGKFRIPS